jgi:putative SOS response-associated peptidase YedK
MCGRYTLGKTPESLLEHFQLFGEVPCFKASYNIAPSESVPIVYQYAGHRLALLMRWGMIPKWSKEPKTKYSTINARAETLTESKLYIGPFKHTRCLVPADGFYEWQQTDVKQPYHICEKGHRLFAFAGLWETWHEGQEDELFSFTIIVTDANPAVSSIHKRMPVILDPEDYSNNRGQNTDFTNTKS